MPISIHFGVDALQAFVLTLARVGAAMLVFPMPGFRNTPQAARIVISVAITFCLFWTWKPAVDPSIGGMTLAIIGQTTFGLFLGLTAGFLAETLQVAAQLISMQTGFSFASTFDPASQADTTIFQVLSQLTSGFLFFALDLHHELFRLFTLSPDLLSPASGALRERAVMTLLHVVSQVLTTGVRLALPVVVLLFLVDISMAVLGRMQMQLQLTTLAFPAKISLSLLLLATILGRWPVVYEGFARRILDSVLRMFTS